MITGYYYLHRNGDLLYKPGTECVADLRESDLALALWPLEPDNRASGWRLLVEAAAAGADMQRVRELATKWGCDDDDAQAYAEHIGARLYLDGSAWCATRADFENMQESPVGFGDTALEAFAALARELGYVPSKMWGATFDGLVAGKAA